jgi:hypothetical protein
MVLSMVEPASQVTPAGILAVVEIVVDESFSLPGSSRALPMNLLTLTIWN